MVVFLTRYVDSLTLLYFDIHTFTIIYSSSFLRLRSPTTVLNRIQKNAFSILCILNKLHVGMYDG